MILGLFLMLQTTEPCTIVFDSTGSTLIQDAGAGQSNFFVGNGFVAHCMNQPDTRIRSDSAAYYARIGRLDLIRRVRIDDPSLLLTANAVTYFTRDERYEARGNVDAHNPTNGLRIRGPRLQYDREAVGVRDTTELFAPGRPTINYYRREDWERDQELAEPYVIIGDRVRMRGDDHIWAGGEVTIDRSDFAAQGDSVWVDFTAGAGELISDPQLTMKDEHPVTLTGDLISFEIEADTLRGMTAWADGDLAGQEFSLRGDTIDITFEDGGPAHIVAWGDSIRPFVISDTYTILADSMAIDTPNELLQMIRAYGGAYAENIPADTTARERDWIAGDTLFIHFVTEPDSTGTDETRPEQLIASGAARALYIVINERTPDLPPAYSYSRADSIVVRMGPNGVQRVDTKGRADGVYLEPIPVVTDSVSATTTAVPPDSVRPPPDSGRRGRR